MRTFSTDAGTRAKLRAVRDFTRFTGLGISVNPLLLGAATVSPELPLGRLAALVGLGICCHLYGFLLNDLVDLPSDRADPARVDLPLVKGSIEPRTVRCLVLLQIPLAISIALLLGDGVKAVLALGIAFALGAVYNVWGKRCPLPPFTDLVQGMAFASLTLAGALLESPSPNALSVTVSLYVGLMMVTLNGVHGGLRDVRVDRRNGARTTTIFFGARQLDESTMLLPGALRAYSYLLQALLSAVVAWPLVFDYLGYTPRQTVLTLAVLVTLLGISGRLLGVAVKAEAKVSDLIAAGTLHLALCPALPVVMMASYIDVALALALILLFYVPLLTSHKTFGILCWSIGRLNLDRI